MTTAEIRKKLDDVRNYKTVVPGPPTTVIPIPPWAAQLCDVVEAMMPREIPNLWPKSLEKSAQEVVDRFHNEERQAVVKWLHEVAGPLPATTRAFLQDIAARIEKGEYEKPLASPLG